jgi:hypothetical protein
MTAEIFGPCLGSENARTMTSLTSEQEKLHFKGHSCQTSSKTSFNLVDVQRLSSQPYIYE